jgi:hypothetical protein
MSTDYAVSTDFPQALWLGFSLDWVPGVISSLKVQDSADGTTWTDLWDCGNPSTASLHRKMLYTWKRYLKLVAAYTVPTGTQEDLGFRVSCTGRLFSRPGWQDMSVCRTEHWQGLRSAVVDTAAGFPTSWPDHEASAKREMEAAIRGRGLDPERILADGHATEPVPEGLENAGAALALWYLLAGGKAIQSELRQKEQEWARDLYTSAMDAALNAGLYSYDADLDAAPDTASPQVFCRVIL